MKRRVLTFLLAVMLATSPAWGNYIGDFLKAGFDVGSSTIKVVDSKNLKVGNGTPTVTQNGEDMYVEGTFEVDSAVRLDSSSLTLRGVAYTLPSADGSASDVLVTDGSGVLSWSAVSGAGNTLDEAYDQGGAGLGRTINANDGAVVFQNTQADNTSILEIGKSPVSSASGTGISVTMGANATGAGLAFVNAGSGNDVTGTGSTWGVTKAGVGSFVGLSTTGTTLFGDGTGTVAVNSSSWDITTSGAVSGITTLGLSGNLTSSAGDLILATAHALKGSSTTAETIAIQVYDNDTGPGYKDAILLTNGNTPAIAIGDNNPTVAINSADWDISATGAMTGIGAITADGLITGSLGATISGATTSVNASSNFGTNINTGTSTGALALGGGSGTVAVDSTTWDISTLGALTGVADITGTAGEAMTITLASNGAADDLTLSVTGANDASVVVSSAGTGSDAIKMSAAAGGIEATAGKAAADQIKLAATGTIAGNAINAVTTDGGIVLTAGGAANGDVTITVGDDFTVNATGDIVLNSADWDISAAGAQTGMASVGFDSGTTVYYATVELSNANIKALRATPIALVAAPAAGYFIEFVSAVLILDYGSEVLTESADNMIIEYNTSGTDASATIEATSFIDAAADTVAVIPAATIANVAASNVTAKALQLTNIGDGEYAGNASNDTTMTVKVAYRVHANGL